MQNHINISKKTPAKKGKQNNKTSRYRFYQSRPPQRTAVKTFRQNLPRMEKKKTGGVGTQSLVQTSELSKFRTGAYREKKRERREVAATGRG